MPGCRMLPAHHWSNVAGTKDTDSLQLLCLEEER